MLPLRPTPPTAKTFLRTLTAANISTTSETNTTLQKLRVLATRGHLEEAFSLFYRLKQPHCPQTFATLFHACACYKNLHLGHALHHHMLTTTTITPPSLHTTNHLINMYAKCGDLNTAHKLFDEMPCRNIVSWTCLITGYAQHGNVEQCFTLFANMLPHLRPNDFAYTSMLSRCDHQRGVQVHALTTKTGFDTCVYVGNALVTMYSNSGYSDEGWRVFSTMEFKNLVSYNSMIAGFQMRGQGDKAIRLFSLMYNDGTIGFDRATILSVISSLCEGDESDTFQGLECCFQLHCVCLKSGFVLDLAVVTALVKAYSCLGGEVEDCRKLFLEAGDQRRDIVLWTGIMTAFAEKDPEGTLFLFCESRTEGLVPDCYAFSIVLKACAGLVTDRHALSVHCQVIKTGFEDFIVLGNALIHAYARCGSIFGAKKIFGEMVSKDLVSWNTMLKAYALHGQSKEALKLFGQMDAKPDATTFVALLSACSHTGMVEEGRQIFNTMLEKYGIAPQLDHYACMVDILGRAGHVHEAEKIIGEMPMEPDYVVWSALIGACRKHGETRLADLAASKLKKLDPENSLGYIMMSHVYCSAGSFDEAGLIRKKMKGQGIKKEPGLSWTEIGKQVHEFASGGQRHPQGEAIRASTKELVSQLKHLGYVPDTNSSFYDVEDEQKEEQLYYHSEKLALVFALMNATESDSGMGLIRIIKNIRICLDCHNFMRFASALVQKEIVVRDSNRFHHFKEGICSCNDYW